MAEGISPQEASDRLNVFQVNPSIHYTIFEKDNFIALIHPIQWTIANLVGPSSVYSPDGASCFLPV